MPTEAIERVIVKVVTHTRRVHVLGNSSGIVQLRRLRVVVLEIARHPVTGIERWHVHGIGHGMANIRIEEMIALVRDICCKLEIVIHLSFHKRRTTITMRPSL